MSTSRALWGTPLGSFAARPAESPGWDESWNQVVQNEVSDRTVAARSTAEHQIWAIVSINAGENAVPGGVETGLEVSV